MDHKISHAESQWLPAMFSKKMQTHGTGRVSEHWCVWVIVGGLMHLT